MDSRYLVREKAFRKQADQQSHERNKDYDFHEIFRWMATGSLA